jgi:hypothetical protein
VKVFVSRLRTKLRRHGALEFIQNKRGIGYRFVKVRTGRSLRSSMGLDSVGAEPPLSVWLAVERVDPTLEARTARRVVSQKRLSELVDSIGEHGVLEPILVIPIGDRYEVVAGTGACMRRVWLGLTVSPRHPNGGPRAQPFVSELGRERAASGAAAHGAHRHGP